MEPIQTFMLRYNFTKEDEENLKKLVDFGKKYENEFVEELHRYLSSLEDYNRFFPNEERKRRHTEILKKWFMSLFSGRYDESFARSLYRTGEVHVKMGVPPHYLHAAMNFKRQYIFEKLTDEYGRTKKRDKFFTSINKILDISLDIMLGSYREEELKLYLATGRFQKRVIEGLRRISYGYSIFIALAMFFAGILLIYLSSYEILMVISGKTPVDAGILSIMGTVLILYAVTELMREEIKYLRGGAFSLKVFIGIALAAVIRKILILSLSPEKIYEIIAISVLLVSLAVVYWSIHRIEILR